MRALLFSLVTSYYKGTKKYLLENVDLEALPAALYYAPFACLVHDRFQEGVDEPSFTCMYAWRSKVSERLMGLAWSALLPSNLSLHEAWGVVAQPPLYRMF